MLYLSVKSKKKKILGKIFIFLAPLFFNTLPAYSIPSSTSSIIRDSPKEVIDQVWQIIFRDYLDSSGNYDQTIWLSLRKELLSTKYLDTNASYEAIREMLASLNDPYTRFLDPKEFGEMKIDTSGELTGVGIQLSVDKNTNQVIVVSPIEGTPAYRAGIKPKDVIVSVDSTSTEGLTIGEVVNLIRGKKGSSVKLGIKRDNSVLTTTLIRDRIEIRVVDSRLNFTDKGLKIGYIRLKQFNANASKEMRGAIKSLEAQNVSGYVLDLRSNPGGLLEASVEIARLWLNKGIIVSTKTRNGIKDIRRANGRALTTKPLVVLVNQGSASASEILSGAIRDNDRGFLVGQKTFGKGLVQSVRSLSDGSGLTVTIAKYLTPKGTDIHQNGIIPDVIIGIPEDQISTLSIEEIGTSKDQQYKVAENTLVKKLKIKNNKSTYDPFSNNLKYALNY